MTSKSRLLSSVVNKPESLIGASLSNPSEVNLQALETAAVKYTASSQLPSTGNIGEQAFVEETNRLYIWNGSGWYNIALINTTPTWDSNGQPAGAYELSADSPQTATTITLAASDPEGIPITYSHVTGGSMDSIATVSQDSSVFTITPKTVAQAPDGGTGSITFRASDGINILPYVSSFTLNFISIAENSRYTTLLATADGTSDNNNITDASSNSHSITVNGDTQAGTFSPYRSGGYSSYGHFRPETVSGTLDTYSLSFWYKLNSVIDYARVFETQSGSFSMMIETDNGGQFSVGGAFETQNDGSGNNYLDSNWHYFVVSRTPSATNWYMDGAQITTDRLGNTITTTLSSLTAQAVRNMTFGGRDATSDLGSLPTTNLADINFRDIELKSTTHDGSVPTEPVTSSSDTVFLTAHKPYGVYEYGATPTSENIGTLGTNFKVLPLSPYDYTEYAANDHGGSVFIEANGGHLSGTLSSGGLGTTFTVEMWIYDDGTGGNTTYGGYFTTTDISSQYGIQLRRYGAYIFNSTTGTNLTWNASGHTFATIFGIGWHHVAAVHNGSTFKVYVDGKEVISTSDSHTYSSVNYKVGQPWLYQSDATQQAKAYISDLRINKSVIYSGEFTPPTAPLSSSGAELHIKGTDASIIDKSQVNNIVMNGPTTGSTTKSAFGSEPTISFMSGSNTNRYLNFDPNVLNFMKILGQPSIPFTIEGIWGWQGSTASPIFEIFQDTNNFFYFGGGTGNTQSGITTDNNLYAIFKIGGVERFKMTAGIGGYNVVGSTFKHQAITRNSSGLMQHYYDGQLRSNTITHTGFDTVSWTSPVGYIGRSDWMGIYGRYEGYIHQVRLTVGLARYTANFTPPTASLEG